MVIFGGSGDLAKRKLIPALYMLHKRSLLENDFKIIATGRSILTSDQFRERAEESLSKYINKRAGFPTLLINPYHYTLH